MELNEQCDHVITDMFKVALVLDPAFYTMKLNKSFNYVGRKGSYISDNLKPNLDNNNLSILNKEELSSTFFGVQFTNKRVWVCDFI